MREKEETKIVRVFREFLIKFAPLEIENNPSITLWGEVKIPESLKH